MGLVAGLRRTEFDDSVERGLERDRERRCVERRPLPHARPAAAGLCPTAGHWRRPTVETSVEPAITRTRPGGSEPSSSASFDTTLEKPRSMFVP